MSYPEQISAIRKHLLGLGLPETFDAAVILGSGLGGFGAELEDPFEIPYQSIPGFPESTVAGHSGSLISGKIRGKSVLAFSGRFHFYEGYGFDKTLIPVQLAKAFDVDKLIISNAAGGINLDFRVGDLMIIKAIIKPARMIAPAQPQTWKYDTGISITAVQNMAEMHEIPVKTGNYFYVTGPNYETKAEIHAFRKMGGDAVGMSTAPELMEASRLKLKTIAVSLITNAAAGVTNQKLDHAEVKEAAEIRKEDFARLVKAFIEKL